MYNSQKRLALNQERQILAGGKELDKLLVDINSSQQVATSTFGTQYRAFPLGFEGLQNNAALNKDCSRQMPVKVNTQPQANIQRQPNIQQQQTEQTPQDGLRQQSEFAKPPNNLYENIQLHGSSSTYSKPFEQPGFGFQQQNMMSSNEKGEQIAFLTQQNATSWAKMQEERDLRSEQMLTTLFQDQQQKYQQDHQNFMSFMMEQQRQSELATQQIMQQLQQSTSATQQIVQQQQQQRYQHSYNPMLSVYQQPTYPFGQQHIYPAPRQPFMAQQSSGPQQFMKLAENASSHLETMGEIAGVLGDLCSFAL